MQKLTFRKKPLVQGIAIALGAAAHGPAMAQSASEAPAELEEIVVTGIRASLERSMDLKRDATGVVDAISAEDMGDFPDRRRGRHFRRGHG